MRRLLSVAGLFTFFLFSSWSATAQRPPNFDYSVGVASAYDEEVQLAYNRLWKFLTHLNPKTRALLEQTPNVAVQATVLSVPDVPGLMHRLTGGTMPQAAQLYSKDVHDLVAAHVKYILIFNSRTRQLVSRDGVLALDTPSRGSVGVFNGIPAVYAGTM